MILMEHLNYPCTLQEAAAVEAALERKGGGFSKCSEE